MTSCTCLFLSEAAGKGKQRKSPKEQNHESIKLFGFLSHTVNQRQPNNDLFFSATESTWSSFHFSLHGSVLRCDFFFFRTRDMPHRHCHGAHRHYARCLRMPCYKRPHFQLPSFRRCQLFFASFCWNEKQETRI